MLERQFDALVAAARGAVPPGRGGTDHRNDTTDGHRAGDGHEASDGHETGDGHGASNRHETGDDDGSSDRTRTGIDFEGLNVRETDAGFTFETPAESATGLDRDGLRARAERSPYVTNWYFWEWEVQRHGRPVRAFLRRAEAADDHAVPERYAALADGLVTEWGQLRIETTVDDDGLRRYEIRHVDEADADRAALTVHRDPRAARDIAETDADGRYRPLKTAPSLAGGWLFPELDWRAATETIDEFYPATIANWHRERVGTLDVDHWRDTAERQTGIYGIVAELGREAVDRVAATCCADSQCLKRREWEYDGETALAADGGTGVFPCREPCSLVVAASRKWTTLEREAERTYEFTLTPSEKEQLEALIDAVADGRVGEIREADVYEGANRYRTRYLREKRLVDGSLCGVPGEPDEGPHDSHDSHDSHDGSENHGDDGEADADRDEAGGGHDADTDQTEKDHASGDSHHEDDEAGEPEIDADD